MRLWQRHAVVALISLEFASAQSYNNNTNPTIPGNNSTSPPALDNAFSPPFYPAPWVDGSGGWADAIAKAKQFVGQLTLLEKVNLTTGTGWMSDACVGNVGSIPRLGFPGLCMQDSPLGIRFADYVSAFPAGGTIAASWDRGEFYRRGYQMGTEHRKKGIDVQLGPVIGPLGRNPKGGRNWEGFSPDPVLSGIAVAETIKGIQAAGVVACTKHYIMNEQEHFRSPGGFGDGFVDALSSNLDDKTLHELYLWPFADAVRAGTGSIMCAYNKVNNSQACQNSYLQNYILKGELGFQGFILSDWDAQHSGVASTLAGLDMTMPGDTDFNSGASFWGPNLTISVINGTVPAWRLDDAAVRIMAAYYYVGRDKAAIPLNFNSWSLDTYGYDHPFAKAGYGLINEHVDVREGHGRAIRLAAARSTVLLKNTNGVLPLTGTEKFTAVFGDDSTENPLGPNGCPDHGCNNGTLAMGWGSGTAFYPYLVTPLEAIKSEVVGNGGVVQSVVNNWAYSQITALARQSSVSIVFVNADSGEGYITVDGNVGDRNNLTFWQDGDQLIRTVAAESNNTIVVIHSVGPIIIEEYKNHPNVTAILWAGLPGEQSGNSIADVLYGRVNPGGKTPFTWGKNESDYGPDLIYEPPNGSASPQDNFNEGVFIDYRAFDKNGITPTYEFGYGLSYTTFSYSSINVVKVPAGPYRPTAGNTQPAPVLGNFSTDPAMYQWPANLTYVDKYIYPYLNSTDLKTASNDRDYGVDVELPEGSQDGSPQARIGAGGAPGGNPQLWDVLFTVTATVTNTGKTAGEEVAQLYISLGGPDDPKVVLRNFDRLSIQAGQTATFTADVTRRDVSNWDPATQNWVITDYPKTAYVGSSSRALPLSAKLDLSDYA